MSRTNSNPHRTLWATTHYGHYPINIYKRTDPAFTDYFDGETTLLKVEGMKAFEIDLGDHIIDSPRWFTNILFHEFTHVLEYCHANEAFSVKTLNGCTPLARTIGVGLSQMLDHLRQTGDSEPKKRRIARSKRRK
jgi:hypothetical protein